MQPLSFDQGSEPTRVYIGQRFRAAHLVDWEGYRGAKLSRCAKAEVPSGSVRDLDCSEEDLYSFH